MSNRGHGNEVNRQNLVTRICHGHDGAPVRRRDRATNALVDEFLPRH